MKAIFVSTLLVLSFGIANADNLERRQDDTFGTSGKTLTNADVLEMQKRIPVNLADAKGEAVELESAHCRVKQVQSGYIIESTFNGHASVYRTGADETGKGGVAIFAKETAINLVKILQADGVCGTFSVDGFDVDAPAIEVAE